MRENRGGEGGKVPAQMDEKSGMYFLSTVLLLQLLQTYLEENKMLFKIEGLKC